MQGGWHLCRKRRLAFSDACLHMCSNHAWARAEKWDQNKFYQWSVVHIRVLISWESQNPCIKTEIAHEGRGTLKACKIWKWKQEDVLLCTCIFQRQVWETWNKKTLNTLYNLGTKEQPARLRKSPNMWVTTTQLKPQKIILHCTHI